MKVVILCGGRGTRLGRESEVRPKPMVSIGDRPILWHIMKYYASFGHKDFILCLGHLGDVIKDHFLHYEARQNDITIELGNKSKVKIHSSHDEQDWQVTLANTGLDTNTGARVKWIEQYLDEDLFFLTYGDGLSNIDLNELLAMQRRHGKLATVSAVHPPARFGELNLKDGRIGHFSEKPQTSAGLINGGFFVFRREALKYLSRDERCSLEHDFLVKLTEAGEVMAYEHHGFWQCMDTVRELAILNELWESGRAPWKTW
ncbi:MAG: glucose-1-phosphate cytidylyltransferase [Acidimicrobiia bacterium]